MRRALQPRRVALLAWKADSVDSDHLLRFAHLPNHLVHLPLECFDRRKARHIECYDYLTRVGRSLVIFIEVDHVAAKRRSIERAGKQTEYQREAIPFVAADWEEEPFLGALRIGQ